MLTNKQKKVSLLWLGAVVGVPLFFMFLVFILPNGFFELLTIIIGALLSTIAWISGTIAAWNIGEFDDMIEAGIDKLNEWLNK